MPLIFVFFIGIIAEVTIVGSLFSHWERNERAEGVIALLVVNSIALVFELIMLFSGGGGR